MNKILIFVIATLITILSILLLWESPIIVAGIIILTSGTLLLFFKRKKYLLLYLIMAISGSIMEYIFIYQGIWLHNSEGILGVPYWIPFVWGYTGISSAILVEILEKY